MRSASQVPDSRATIWPLLTSAVAIACVGLLSGCAPVERVDLLQPRPLPAAKDTANDEFQQIIAVRELSDGRVLVAEFREQRVALIDFDARTSTGVARQGQGPGEYGRVNGLYAMGADSTLWLDLTLRRWLLLDGAQVAVTVPPTDTLMRITYPMSGASAMGYVLVEGRAPSRDGTYTIGPHDSVPLILVHRQTARSDTVGQARMQPYHNEVRVDANGEFLSVTRKIPAWAAPEQAMLCRDGWIAVVRVEPYRVDWRKPDGEWVIGPAIPYELVPVTGEEKANFMARTVAGTNRAASPAESLPDWPAHVPPVALADPLCDAHGNAVVRRNSYSTQPNPFYDVISRSGALVDRVVVGPRERIIGFGNGTVYVTALDEYNVQRLLRHSWPERR